MQLEQRGKDIEAEKSKNYHLSEEISNLRNPQGFSHFIHAVKQFNDSAAELDRLNQEKWNGLVAMDSCLESFYDKAEQQRLKRLQKRIKAQQTKIENEFQVDPDSEQEEVNSQARKAADYNDKLRAEEKHSSAWSFFKSRNHIRKVETGSQTDVMGDIIAAKISKRKSQEGTESDSPLIKHAKSM